jgi:signal peptidase I
MSKHKYPNKPERQPIPADAEVTSRWPSAEAVRETVESVVIAFVLAFLFRTFEAEPFVIPTGSMAPTLMGRHKDVVCSICGNRFQVGASEEVSRNGDQLYFADRFDARVTHPVKILSATCPMCRHTEDLEKEPSYNGDRILVNKFAYDIGNPRRWDVIVFKFPGDTSDDSRANYIKRLIGLPGDTVRIDHGDIWISRDHGRTFEIARKPPEKLLTMLQPVFDNDYMTAIANRNWPQRWFSASKSAGEWKAGDSASFYTTGQDPDASWLRYEHRVPSYDQWAAAEQRPSAAPPLPSPQYITDYTAYDTNRYQGGSQEPPADGLGNYWVGDLALRCAVDVENYKGALIFELRKGGRFFQCRIDAATGRATLSITGPDAERNRPNFEPAAQTAVRGVGRHEIIFSNCDNEMLLWVDGRVMTFDAPTRYDSLGNTSPRPSDLQPVGIASVGVKARVSHLAILRDLYYISRRLKFDNAPPKPDPTGLARLKNDLEGPEDRTLDANSFFAMGDNSARSKDGRDWGVVPRELLIGRAVFIYWPHSWNTPFPFFPNVRRMGVVR